MRLLILALVLCLTTAAAQAAPRRVVSMNLCTDQLAMLLAAPDQLISVSHIARDPISSAMHVEALDYEVNHGLAEEIFLMQPDLVLAGEYSAQSTVDMLTRLGIEVVRQPIAESFAALRGNITQMGAWLGRAPEAAAMIASFDADIAALPAPKHQFSAVLHYANSYSSGQGTLADEILRTAGFSNLAADLGYRGLARLPLEVLVMARPELIVQGQDYGRPALAQEVLRHPALAGFERIDRTAVADNLWVCGTPHVARAVAQLVDARIRLEGGL